MSLRPSRRVILVALAVVLAAVVTRVAAPAPERQARFSAALSCGVERWTVKTLQDRPRLIRAQPTTVAHLGSLKPPKAIPFFTRLPFERHIFSVVAAVTLVRQESDEDLHVVLKSGRSQMITEAPAPACTSRATPPRRRQMTKARQAVRVCARARVVGVAFFDYFHFQTGVAPNGIELHPILGFACLSG